MIVCAACHGPGAILCRKCRDGQEAEIVRLNELVRRLRELNITLCDHRLEDSRTTRRRLKRIIERGGMPRVKWVKHLEVRQC